MENWVFEFPPPEGQEVALWHKRKRLIVGKWKDGAWYIKSHHEGYFRSRYKAGDIVAWCLVTEPGKESLEPAIMVCDGLGTP